MQESLMWRSKKLLSTYQEWEELKKAKPGHAYCSTENLPNHPISDEEADASFRIYNDFASQASETYHLPLKAHSIMDKWLSDMDCAEKPASTGGEAKIQVRRIMDAGERETVDQSKEAMTSGDGSMSGEKMVTEYNNDYQTEINEGSRQSGSVLSDHTKKQTSRD
jgi:hypothetical protein